MRDFSQHTTLDLFSGSGVGVAHQWLGATEWGVDNDKWVQATRELNGMNTLHGDVWTLERKLREYPLPFTTHWGSPPCQMYSNAGNGAGRQALYDVLNLLDDGWDSIEELKVRAAQIGDLRIGLVLTPIHYAWLMQPTYIALEQVPPVLPVWEAMAAQLSDAGYSTWTGILNAEQYGVPQTRKRAILMARRDGKEAKAPTPTHSRYYTRDPQRLDTGVQKWVSMSEALGWGLAARPSPTITGGGTETGGAEPIAKLSRYPEIDHRISTDEAATLQSYPMFTQNNKLAHASYRTLDHPAPTITAGHDSGNRGFVSEQGFVQATVGTIADLQSYPGPFQFAGPKTKQYLQIGNACPPLLTKAILEELWS